MHKTQTMPYQLPQKLYGVWYEVGEQLGPLAQAAVAVALCDGKRVPTADLVEGQTQQISKIARSRGVILPL